MKVEISIYPFFLCPVFSVFSVRYLLMPLGLTAAGAATAQRTKKYRTENTENTGQKGSSPSKATLNIDLIRVRREIYVRSRAVEGSAS